MPIFNIGSGGGGAASVPDATTTTAGKVRLATVAEANAGTSELIAVTPAGLQDAIAGIVGGMEFKGAYDIGIGVPDLSNASKGDYYVVTNVRTNPSDTNDTKVLYGQEWAVGDHLVVTEDMGGTVSNDKITKVDNSESISVLGDLLDVALSAEAANHVLVYEDTAGEWQNRQLSVDDLIDVASQTDLTALTLRVDTAETDITSIDGRVTVNEGDINAIELEIGTIESGAGLNSNGSYTPDPTATYISAATSLKNADSLLDDQVKANADNIASNDTDISNLQSELDATQAGAGLGANGTYTANVSTNYIASVTSLKGADEALDSKLKETRDLVDNLGANNVASVNTITPVAGDVTLASADIDSARTATNYTATSADVDGHLAGIDSALLTESTARSDADTTLQSNIDAEATTRANADTTLQTNINNEATTRANADTALQGELDATQTGAGLETDGTYAANASTNYLTTATSLKGADEALDAKLKETRDLVDNQGANSVSSVNGVSPVAGDVTIGGADIDSAHTAVNYTATSADVDAHLAGIDSALLTESTVRSDTDTALQDELDATQTGAGLEADGTYSANASTNYLTTATSLVSADEALDTQLKAVTDITDTLGTASTKDAGSAIGDVVLIGDVGGHAALPVLDGSQLTNITVDLTSGSIGELGDVTLTTPAEGDALILDANGDFVNVALADIATSGEAVDATSAHTAVNYTAAASDVDSHLAGIDAALLTEATARGDADTTLQTNIDNEATARADADTALQDELDATQTGAGLGTDGAYTANASTNYLTTATSLVSADEALDAKLKETRDLVDSFSAGNVASVNGVTPVAGDVTIGGADIDSAHTATNYTATSADVDGHLAGIDSALLAESTARGDADTALQDELDATQTGAGLGTDGTYAANVSTNYIASVTSLKGADEALDAQVKTNADDIALKANIASPALTGTPTAPTAAQGTNTTQIATTQFVKTELSSLSTTAQGAEGVVQTSDGAGNFVASQWAVPSANGHLTPSASSTYDLGTASARARDLFADNVKLGTASLALSVDGTSGRLTSGGGATELTADSAEVVLASDLATVATSGDYGDLSNAPTSFINSAEFITDADPLNIVAGKHYIMGTATGSTKTLTLPSVTANGQYIRVTNWGLGELVVQVDPTDTDAYLLVGQNIVNGGSVTIESKATVDLFGFNYSQGGTDYSPAWGVYFSSSIELNTKSFNTTGQLPYYDATAQELKAGDLGNLTFSFAPTNYDNTRGGTVTGDAVGDHFGGVDDALGLKANSADLADIATSGASEDASVTLTATEYTAATQDVEAHLTGINTRLIDLVDTINGEVVGAGTHEITLGGEHIDTAHTASDYTAAASDLDSHLAGIDTRLAEKVNAADGLNGLDDVDLTVAPTDGQILLFDGVSSTFKPGPPPAPVADETTLGLVELATDAEAQAATATDRALTPSNLVALDLDTFNDVAYPSAPTDGQILKWVAANNRWEPAALVPSAPKVTSDTPASTYSITTHDGIEEIYLLTPSVDCTVSIPTAADAGSGFKYFIKNLSTNVLTINATIDGQASFDLTNQYSAVGIVSDGTNWFIF
jgi:hypothetical protein